MHDDHAVSSLRFRAFISKTISRYHKLKVPAVDQVEHPDDRERHANVRPHHHVHSISLANEAKSNSGKGEPPPAPRKAPVPREPAGLLAPEQLHFHWVVALQRLRARTNAARAALAAARALRQARRASDRAEALCTLYYWHPELTTAASANAPHTPDGV